MSDFFPIFDLGYFLDSMVHTPRLYLEWKNSFNGVFCFCFLRNDWIFYRCKEASPHGDAISHGILPGLVLAFILSQSKALIPMFIGACAAGMLCNFCIEWLNKKTPIKLDSAMGLTFTSFFALGIILIAQFANNAHIDAECLLYGEIGYIPLEKHISIGDFHLGPRPLVFMGWF